MQNARVSRKPEKKIQPQKLKIRVLARPSGRSNDTIESNWINTLRTVRAI